MFIKYFAFTAFSVVFLVYYSNNSYFTTDCCWAYPENIRIYKSDHP